MDAFKIVVFIIMILISVFFAANFTIKRAKRIGERALILKALASVCFILLGFVAFWAAKNTPSMMILPGLVFGLIGDIYLDMKFVYPESDVLYTFVGFGAFILGHVFYLIFLFTQYGSLTSGIIVSLVIGIVGGLLIFFTEKLMSLHYGRFKIISAFYGALLIFVTAYSCFICFSRFSASRFLFFFGLLLFLISDLILSQIYFGKDKNTPKNSILNHSTYYLAQILIASSSFFI